MMRHPGLYPLHDRPAAVGWFSVVLALSGLVLLCKTTRANPGFISMGDTVSTGLGPRKASPLAASSGNGDSLL